MRTLVHRLQKSASQFLMHLHRSSDDFICPLIFIHIAKNLRNPRIGLALNLR